MEVLRRRQITEVEVKRSISHDLLLDDTVYTRRCDVTTNTPYMCSDINQSKVVISWMKYVTHNTVAKVYAKDAKRLKLEEKYQALDLNDRNGNGKYESYKFKS